MKYTKVAKMCSIVCMIAAFCGSWLAIYDHAYLRALAWSVAGLWAFNSYINQNTIETQAKTITRLTKKPLIFQNPFPKHQQNQDKQ